jgi:phospholipid/cholesterol/gamma-HCH transport system ATP-binding protein
MVFQNGALFDSITVGENVAFPLRERHDLAEDQIQQIVTGMLDMVGVPNMERRAALRPLHRHEALRRHRAGAGVPARGRALRRAHHHGRSADGPSSGQPHRAPENPTAPDQHRSDPRHALARKLADRVVFLHQGEVRFFGTVEEMDRSDDPDLQEFLGSRRTGSPGYRRNHRQPGSLVATFEHCHVSLFSVSFNKD